MRLGRTGGTEEDFGAYGEGWGGGKDAGRQMEKGGREGASVRIAKVI